MAEKQHEEQPRRRGPGRPWHRGQSGNPAGRPPNKSSLTALLREQIEKVNPDDPEGRTWRELLALAVIRLAIEGNATELTLVWNRIDGPVPQTVEEDWRGLPLIQVNWGKRPDEDEPTESLPVPSGSAEKRTDGHT